MRSTAACVTASDGERLGDFFFTGKSFVVSETHFDDVLGMYNVRHQSCSIVERTYHPYWTYGSQVPLMPLGP